MTPPRTPRTEDAQQNLRAGIKKMEKVMSPAAQVRRDFRLGRPPKAGQLVPLHRSVVWQKATKALADFRGRMAAASLNPKHVDAAIVFIELAAPDSPRVLLLETEGQTPEESRAAAFEVLGRDDVIALGMIFRQFDEQSQQQSTFPYQFMGLNERGVGVLKAAATLQVAVGELRKDTN